MEGGFKYPNSNTGPEGEFHKEYVKDFFEEDTSKEVIISSKEELDIIKKEKPFLYDEIMRQIKPSKIEENNISQNSENINNDRQKEIEELRKAIIESYKK